MTDPVDGPLHDETAAPHEGAAELRRVRWFSLGAWAFFAAGLAISGSGWLGFLGLTCSAGVAMINFLWLEKTVRSGLRSVVVASAWRLGLGTLARFTLLCVALAISILVARFDGISVLLGFSVVVAGIMCEAVYTALRNARGAEAIL